MTPTYRAMEVSRPGHLQLVERPLPQPEPGEVLIAVEACGICGADRGDIESADPAAQRVPGNEVVGGIVAIGAHVLEFWHKGQRVGVGRFSGPSLECAAFRSGRLHQCRN